MDFRGKIGRRWLNYEAYEEAYLGNSAFYSLRSSPTFPLFFLSLSLVQSKVIDLETLASIGHYYFIHVFFFFAISQARTKQDLQNRNSNEHHDAIRAASG